MALKNQSLSRICVPLDSLGRAWWTGNAKLEMCVFWRDGVRPTVVVSVVVVGKLGAAAERVAGDQDHDGQGMARDPMPLSRRSGVLALVVGQGSVRWEEVPAAEEGAGVNGQVAPASVVEDGG